MRNVYLLFLLLLGSQLLQAQTRSQIGYVKDAQTNEPLEGAFVASPGSEKGTYTNEEGLFILEITDEKAVEVVVKYLGYKTEIFISDPTKAKPIEVFLTQDEITLKPTVITDKALRRVHPDPTLYIKDYAFLDEYYLMVVLDPDLRRNKLVLLDQELKTVEEHFGLGEEPVSLFTDCMGAKHYLTPNHACQVDLVNGQLVVQKSSREDFDRVVLPCRALQNDTYYFEDRKSRFATGYYFVEQWKGVKSGFYWTMDSVSIRTMEDEGMIDDKIVNPGALATNAQRAGFQAALDARYLEAIQCPESYAPLFMVDGKVTIFDHNRDLIVRFDDHGRVNYEAPINYDKERFWERTILVDEEKKRAFTVFNRLGKYTLAEISLQDGSILKRWDLPKRFVSRIQIRDREIYFLYKDNIYDPVNRLYAFNMDWE